MHESSAQESKQVLNYTIVTLVGMLAGLILGCVFARSTGSPVAATATPVPHPRAIEVRP